jgi:hypothetical protein
VENALLALPPINRRVPMASIRITANITAYSAMSCHFHPTNCDNQQLRKGVLKAESRALLPGVLSLQHRSIAGRNC